MSNFTGVTFAEQTVTPSDDAIVRRAILPDGILSGCELSYSGSTLTMAAGHLMACGRQIRHPSAQNWAVVDATSGYARLLLTIDLTRTATEEAFDQVVDSIEYASAEDGFVDLEQADINRSGTRYQVAVCVVSLGTGGITGIVSKLEKCEVGAGLNFNVVGGLTQPSGPKENTIWVNTSEKITSWIFSATEPTEKTDGMVWITIGASSLVSFNALKKNAIQVYPISAKQYIGGIWMEVTAKSYQGEWVDWWSGHLYEIGNQYEYITGGWQARAVNSDSGGYEPTTPMLNFDEHGMTVSVGSTFASGVAECKKDVNLTSFKTLTVQVPAVTFVTNVSAIAIWVVDRTELSETKEVASSPAAKTGWIRTPGEYNIDISTLNREYDVAVWVSTTSGDYTSITVSEIMLR